MTILWRFFWGVVMVVSSCLDSPYIDIYSRFRIIGIDVHRIFLNMPYIYHRVSGIATFRPWGFARWPQVPSTVFETFKPHGAGMRCFQQSTPEALKLEKA